MQGNKNDKMEQRKEEVEKHYSTPENISLFKVNNKHINLEIRIYHLLQVLQQ